MEITVPDWITKTLVGTLGLIAIFALLKWAFGLGWSFELGLGF